MRITFLFILFTIQLALSEMASAKDEVGNGAGLAEKNVAFAYWNIEKYVDLCLTQERCRLDGFETSLLQNIRTSLDRERNISDQLEFLSEKANPGFFVIDGQVRIAKTGDHVGDKIYFNLDLIYKDEPGKKEEVLSIPDATALLVHELGHHQGVKDHSRLDLLGAKVQTILLGNSQRVDVWPYISELSATAVRFDSPRTFSQFYIQDGSRSQDLSEKIKSSVGCGPGYPTADLTGIWIWNLRWDLGRATEDLVEVIFTAGLFVNCDYGIGPVPMGRHRLQVTTYVNKANSLPNPEYHHFQPNLTQLSIEECPIGKTSCP